MQSLLSKIGAEDETKLAAMETLKNSLKGLKYWHRVSYGAMGSISIYWADIAELKDSLDFDNANRKLLIGLNVFEYANSSKPWESISEGDNFRVSVHLRTGLKGRFTEKQSLTLSEAIDYAIKLAIKADSQGV